MSDRGIMGVKEREYERKPQEGKRGKECLRPSEFSFGVVYSSGEDIADVGG